jgi:hypothetical protein
MKLIRRFAIRPESDRDELEIPDGPVLTKGRPVAVTDSEFLAGFDAGELPDVREYPPLIDPAG